MKQDLILGMFFLVAAGIGLLVEALYQRIEEGRKTSITGLYTITGRILAVIGCILAICVISFLEETLQFSISFIKYPLVIWIGVNMGQFYEKHRYPKD